MMRFSIVIPSYNREKLLHGCLTAIVALDYPHDSFEVIIVDDGSAQHLSEVILPFLHRISLRILRQKNSGPARARNFGAEHARGELLAFLDDDCAPRKDWLKQLELAVSRSAGALIGGKTFNGCRNNIFAEVNQRLLDAVSDWFRNTGSPLQFFPSNNFVVAAHEFQEIGGFDATFSVAGGEDREFCARWLRSGRQLVSAPQACIDHFHPQTMRSFLNMHFRYGGGAAVLHKTQRTSPLRYMQTGLYRHLLLTVAQGDRSFTACQLLGLSQIATAAGFLYTRSKCFSRGMR